MGRRKSSSSGRKTKPGPFASLSGKKSRSGKRRRGSAVGRFFRKIFFTTLALGFCVALAGSLYYGFRAMQFDLEEIREAPQRTLVYDRAGNLLGHVAGHGENRVAVPVSEVSPHFVKALLAREDSRFYKHGGVDFIGVARAVVTNLRAGGTEQGASTLTMQLARNTFGMREMSLQRKFMEVALSQRIERQFTKDEILAYYMNRVYFGSGLYGIERAAQGYFMKPAADLTLAESSMLAGVIRGPSLLNPFRSMENAKDIQGEVLARLVDADIITATEATEAKSQKISLRPPNQRLATGSYPLQAVFDLLDDYLPPHLIETGGLKIHTTVDSALQTTAEKTLDRHLTTIEKRPGYKHSPRSSHQEGKDTKYLQGAVVSIDNRSGGILALVGGRDFGESSYNRAYRARRQVGSTFKPFVYAVAFDRGGLLPGAYVSDDPIHLQTGGSPAWSPKNSDGSFTGLQPAALGLIRSRNTMSVRVGQIAGIPNVRGMARELKFGDIPKSPVISLGAFETTPVTITSAYSTFAAKGVNLTPYLIDRIELHDGSVLYQNEVQGRPIFPESVSWLTSDILSKVLDEGTATEARKAGYTAPASGKTGTTNDYIDAWFVGFTDKVTTGVWVGLDQPKTIMDRGYGGTLALPIWTEVMKTAETAGYAGAKIPPPPGSSNTHLCRECGLIASNRTKFPYQMDLPADLRPRGSCRGHGNGLFTQSQDPQPFPVPGELLATGSAPASNQPTGESGVGNAIRGIGKFIFGERR
jgi:penicillin-binding protein 1A